MMPAPIALFAFNRPMHLKRTLSALAANDLAAESDMTIFCDGPRHEEEKKLTDAVREVAACAVGFHSITIITHEQNLGCAESVIGGMEYMFTRHERLVVIEDDILCSRYTLSFLNACLEKYAAEPTVFSIAAWAPPPHLVSIPKDFPYDVYFTPRFHCWGWASWRDRWERVDWEVSDYVEFARQPYLQRAFCQGGDDLAPMLKKQMEGCLDSWAVRMDYSRFKHGCLGLNPVYSYTTNIGMGSGTHTTRATTIFDNDLSLALQRLRMPGTVFMDNEIVRRRYLLHVNLSLWKRILRKLQRLFFRQYYIMRQLFK
jgi:hypothetical protein